MNTEAKTTKASDTQVGGAHYKDMGQFQPWNVLAHWLTPEEYRGYQKGVAISYLARERGKGGDQDIRKAAHHLQRLVEELDAMAAKAATAESTAAPADQIPVAEIPATAKISQQAEKRPSSAPHEDADGWTPWVGVECPVTEQTLVSVRLRNGLHIHYKTVLELGGVKRLNWQTAKVKGKKGNPWDIVAYKIHNG